MSANFCPMSSYPKTPQNGFEFHVECQYCGHACYVDFRDVALEAFAYVKGDWFCDALCVKLAMRNIKRRTPYVLKQ